MVIKAIHPECGGTAGLLKIEGLANMYVWCSVCREWTPIKELRVASEQLTNRDPGFQSEYERFWEDSEDESA